MEQEKYVEEMFKAPYFHRLDAARKTGKKPHLEPHEILHYLRSEKEAEHIEDLVSIHFCGRWGTKFTICRESPQIKYDSALSFWNKTVPIYVLNDAPYKRFNQPPHTFVPALLNYVYGRWFRLYHNEIDHGEFLARIVQVNEAVSEVCKDYKAVVEPVVKLHNSICDQLDRTREAMRAFKESDNPDERDFYCVRYNVEPYSDRSNPGYLTHPIFKAVALVICRGNYETCQQVRRIHRIPVTIILTGHTRGLSAPIPLRDFASHQIVNGKEIAHTTLAEALDFIMKLQEREDLERGPKPNPVKSFESKKRRCGQLFYSQMATERFGWPSGQPLDGPSSSWVDLDKFPMWVGLGKEANARMREITYEDYDLRHLRGNCDCELKRT